MAYIISTVNPAEFRSLLPLLSEIYRQAYRNLPEYSYGDPAEVTSYLNWLYDGDPAGFFVVRAGEPPRVVAFASLHGAWRERNGAIVAALHELVVLPAWQRLGIGSALLRHTISLARQLGRDRLSLWVGEHNQFAQDLYRHFGFQPSGVHGPWLHMTLQLSVPPQP